MLSFGSNIAALAALRRLNNSVEELGASSQRLASGMRINRASDDAAGLAIASALNKDTRVYSQAIRNGNDAISALAIAEGSANELTSVLTRLRELAEQSANGTFSRTQRLSLDREGKALTDEYNRLVASTSFNGLNLLNGTLGRMNIQLGYGSSGSIGTDIGTGLQRQVGTGMGSAALQYAGDSISMHRYADFNGDSILDLATANPTTGLEIAIGNGDGTFKATLMPAYKVWNNLEVYDFDRDGKMDIVSGLPGQIRVFKGQGDGTFVDQNYSASAFDADGSLVLSDFNGDGLVDLATTGIYHNNLVVMLGDGKGNFSDHQAIDLGFQNGKLKLGDINGDGRKDIVAGDNNSTISGFTVSGSAAFSESRRINTGKFGYSAFDVGDFNLDGVDDIVTGSSVGHYRILTGNGDGTYQVGDTNSTADSIFSIRAGDLDGDGILDLAFGASNLSVVRGNGDGSFGSESVSTVGAILDGGFEIADLNGDGVNDVSSGSVGTQNVFISFASTAAATTVQRINLTTQDEARMALSLLDTMFARVQKEIGILGAGQSRIASAIGNLAALRENSAAAESRIRDVDVAAESARVASLSILRQTGAAVLAQANQAPSLALSLLSSIR